MWAYGCPGTGNDAFRRYPAIEARASYPPDLPLAAIHYMRRGGQSAAALFICPATTRTLRGAASQIAAAETKLRQIDTQNAGA